MPNNIKLYDGTTDPEDHLSRFDSAANSGEWTMPVWCRMFQQTLDGSARGWFERLPHDNINEWADLREAFAARFSVRRACFKEPHEITKIVRKANESLTAFKERWTVELHFIMGVPEVMKISSFMDSVKSPEIAKRFSDKFPTTVNEMMERLDDFVRSEEAYASTKLPKGETRESHRKISLPPNGRDIWPRPRKSRRDDYRNRHRERDTYRANKLRGDRAPYPPPRGEYNRRAIPILSLDSLTKRPKEILATETHLRLSIPRPMLNPLRSGNTDWYYDYYQEKGHYTNGCIQLRKQLERALESGKLNHLVKDVRRGGRGPRAGRSTVGIINVISVNSMKDKKRKVREMTEAWMNVPITFPAIPAGDISKEPLIVEADVEGYLVKRVYVDEWSSVEVIFEHCFENFNPKIKAGLRETQTDLVGFAGEISKPLGNIELEVCFGNRGLRRRVSMKFIVVRAPSPYKIILGRPGLKILRAIPSTIHAMMKFPTPNGVATLVTRTLVIVECRHLEKKQMVEEESPKEEGEVAVTEEVLVNPSFPDQLVTIGRGLSEAGRGQLKRLLKDNMEVFMWEPSDMTGVPQRIIEHELNMNLSLNPVCQKRRTFSIEKSRVVTNEVAEWVKAGIVRPVKYPTYISNPVVVKKGDGTWRMCIDFKNLNSACPKDYYPLPNIDCKSEKRGRHIPKAGRLDFPIPNKKELGGICGRHEAISAVLLTDRKERKCRVQYVSRILNEAEKNYAPMEKLVLALIHMTRRLRRYFEARPVKFITSQPIRNVLNNTETSGKLAKYAVEIGAYNVTFIPRNAVKGQVLADFLSEAPEGEKEDPKGSGAGLVLIGPSGIEYTYALRLTFPSTNNEAKYESLLVGLRIARQMNISNIEVKVDFKLVASQINGSYEASKDSMIKYLAKAKEYASGFKSFLIENIPRNMNQKADVLSKLSSVAFNHLTKEVLVEVLSERSTEGQEIHTVVEEEGDNWMTLIKQCLEERIWPKDKNEARCLRVKIGQYAMESGVLFKRGYLVPMLRYKGTTGPLCMKTPRRRFGLPRVIVTDNVAQLVNDPFKSWCGRFEIHQMNTSVAYPQANGLVERANRSLMEGTKTRLGWAEAGWVDEMPNVLKEGKQRLLGKEGTRQRWNSITTRRSLRQVLGLESLCSKEIRPAGRRTKARWDQSGKDHTWSWKHMKTVPTSYKL
nr:reverse transcriptase domain-containing protein [Tanacetum cinerariifolium]